MKYWEVEIQPHDFFSSELEGQWTVSRPSTLQSQTVPSNRETRGVLGP
jgi:hypothetical protein